MRVLVNKTSQQVYNAIPKSKEWMIGWLQVRVAHFLWMLHSLKVPMVILKW
jgi:hypothetical protein